MLTMQLNIYNELAYKNEGGEIMPTINQLVRKGRERH